MYQENDKPIPLLDKNTNGTGQVSMSIPKYGIFGKIIPTAQFYKFKKYKRINGFVMFRTLLQKILRKSIGYSSRKAGKAWKLANDEFKDLFAGIAREVSESEKSFEFKHVSFVETSKYKKGTKGRINNKIRLNKSVKPIRQEKVTGNLFESDLDFFELSSP